MKKLVVLFVALFVCSSLYAQQPTLDDNEKAFQSITTTNAEYKVGVKFSAVTDTNQVIQTSSEKMAVKIWFADEAGKPYNPTKHRFNPNEKFYIWVLSSCPVTVALFQNYPDDRPLSRLVYPVARVPQTYAVLQPGKPVPIPLPFRMDDDMRTELMSIVVAKADINITAAETAIQNNQSVNIIAEESSTVIVNQNIDSEQNQPVQIDSNQSEINNVQQNQRRIVKCMEDFDNRRMESKQLSVKFNPCEGNTITTATGAPQRYDNSVCLILFGDSKLAQYQITMHK